MNWDELGRSVPREKVEAFRASHNSAVAPDLSRNQTRRIESSISAQNDLACTGNCCAGVCDCTS